MVSSSTAHGSGQRSPGDNGNPDCISSVELAMPIRYYLDPEIFERERQTIFAKEWILAGYLHQLSQPGDYLTMNLAGTPLFVRKNPNGHLESFQNICPHRAGPIVFENSTNQKNLMCRYHGWTFNDDGSLRNARDFGGDLDETIRGKMCLTSVRVQSWHNMVFVNLDPDSIDLIEWLGAFPAKFDKYVNHEAVFHSSTSRLVNCNWKVYSDNFLENYHIPTIHPEMARDIDALSVRVVFEGDPRWNTHLSNPKQGSTFGAFGYFWPNFAFDAFPGGYAIERWLPRGLNRTELIFEYFFDADALDVDTTIRMSEQVASEDAEVCEYVQISIASGNYSPGPISPRHENGLVAFKKLVMDAISNGPIGNNA